MAVEPALVSRTRTVALDPHLRLEKHAIENGEDALINDVNDA